ncbi:hypothetical protein PG996_008599 [Apiospora saccharicola]|uniref:Glycine-rich cell wall structural protein 1 n=1 Tax=Apiospora saccharicola TaxID=335842 RepID=A0ABR1UYC9_9PEZI
METVNSMAAAAAKAVWGESDTTATANNETHGQEPISGAQGNVSKGEPFDKGNMDPQPSAASVNTHEASTTTPSTSTMPSTSTHQPTSTLNEHASTTTPTTSSTTTVPHHETAQFAKTTGTAAGSDEAPATERSELKAKDTPADSTKAQNDTRDPSDPKTNPKNAPTDVDNTGEGINAGQDLDKIPAPKPLDELARERGGDAGKVGDGATSSSVDKTETAGEKKDEAEDPNDPHAKSAGEGTGEKYVKTTGLQADGGDFDATKPGAGREADRLLEQKGIHVTKGVPPKPEDEAADKHDKHAADKATSDKHSDKDSAGSGEKKSTISKIKEKLHRH